MKMRISHLTTVFFFLAFALLCLAGCSVAEPASVEGNVGREEIAYARIMQGIDYGDVTYVVGHKSPDTDTVCSAIAYAELKQTLGVNCKAVVSGKVNNETKFALSYFGVDVPEIMEQAAGKTMILVDHSAYTQALDGMEDARIVEILDHHGLGDIQTKSPLIIKDMPIGATATIVYISYLEYDVEIDKTVAGLMLAAVLSDTGNLTLATTTDLDREAVEQLAEIAGVDDVAVFYRALSEAAASYEGMTDEEIFYSDYKEYDMSGTMVGIACVNASAENGVAELSERMRRVMETVYAEQDMGYLYVMLQDNDRNQTKILCFGPDAESYADTAFDKNASGEYVFSFLASRKKDVVPALETVYEALEKQG